MTRDDIDKTLDDDSVFGKSISNMPGSGEVSEIPMPLSMDDSTEVLTGGDSGEGRLHALASHALEDHHPAHPQTTREDVLAMEQTMDEQQHAEDLLGLSGGASGGYEQVYGDGGISGLLEAQEQARREEQNVDEHGYPLDQHHQLQLQQQQQGQDHEHHHQSLEAAMYHDGLPGGEDDQAVENQLHGGGADENYPPAGEKGSRKRKRKNSLPEPDADQKKAVHVSPSLLNRNPLAVTDAVSLLCTATRSPFPHSTPS